MNAKKKNSSQSRKSLPPKKPRPLRKKPSQSPLKNSAILAGFLLGLMINVKILVIIFQVLGTTVVALISIIAALSKIIFEDDKPTKRAGKIKIKKIAKKLR